MRPLSLRTTSPDSLDELGHYRFKPGSRSLVLAVGLASSVVPPDIESADFFSVELDDAGKPQFTNITLTSGVAQPPFLVTPELDPVAVSWTPAQDAIFFHDDQGGDEGELDALALLVARLGRGVALPDAERLVRVGLDPDRLDQGLARVAVRVGGGAVVDRQHPLGPALDRGQTGVGGDRVEPGAKGASALEAAQSPPGA